MSYTSYFVALFRLKGYNSNQVEFLITVCAGWIEPETMGLLEVSEHSCQNKRHEKIKCRRCTLASQDARQHPPVSTNINLPTVKYCLSSFVNYPVNVFTFDMIPKE